VQDKHSDITAQFEDHAAGAGRPGSVARSRVLVADGCMLVVHDGASVHAADADGVLKPL
jgi:hypothetical protein